MKKYYSCESIEKVKSQFKLLLGGRNIGKSYSVKGKKLLDAINNGTEIIYLRRWKEDIKNDYVERYFSDLNIRELSEKWSDIQCWQGKIFLCNRDSDGKAIDKKLIGYYHCLSQGERYKSQMFPNVTDIIFEEFITDKGYLPNEPEKLQDYVSTIFRERVGVVWCIGNTITKLCPYFSDWGLDNVSKQKIGTIEIYENTTEIMNESGVISVMVSIAVELCTAKNVISKMAFGNSSSMIIKNEWKTKRFPKVDSNILLFSETIHTLFCIYDNLKFKLELRQYNDTVFWYVSPFTKRFDYFSSTRIVMKEPSPYYLHTTKFYPLSSKEFQAFELLRKGKIFYCNDSTGTDFSQVLNKIGF